MIDYFSTFINTNGLAFPNTLTVNASGPSATDGTEVTKNMVDDIWGARQALLDRAGISPNSIAEAPGASQVLDAIEKAFGLGAGVYKFWGLDADPAVSGHRVLLLSNQGILRASYLALDAACYVGDIANPTAPYFYHADDAAGTIRNVAGAYLILPPGKQLYEKQYSEVAGDFTLSGPAGWVTTRAVAIPYQTADGAWRKRFNIQGVYTLTAGPFTIAISGLVFKTGIDQAVIACHDNASNIVSNISETLGGTNTMTFYTTNSSSRISVSGDVELDAAPTWIDGFNYPLAITY